MKSYFDFDWGSCQSVLYMDCYTLAVIRLSAKHRRRQTSLIVAVFISSYVTYVTFFVGIWGFVAENNHSPVNITVVFMYSV